ncbi:hypothetical protein QAA62_19215, partial [Klebsiella pneumoniae]|nr:hypothetical protein [Klebsiella pneumoniae]
MSRSETQITWMAENVLSWETVSGHITQRDLNRYYLLDVYLQAHFSDYVLLPGWFSEHSHLARPEKRDFIASLKRFLLSYRPAGRLTIFRYLNMFFIWQSVNQYDYGTAEGVEMYIKHLMNDIRRRKISVRMARIQIITATPMVHRREEANCRFWYASSRQRNKAEHHE